MNISNRTISEYEAWTALLYGIAGCTKHPKLSYKQGYIKRVLESNIKFFGIDFNTLYQVAAMEYKNKGQLKFLTQYIPCIPEDEKEIIYCKVADMAYMGGELDNHELLYLRLLAEGFNLEPHFVQNVNNIFSITHRGNSV